MARQVRAGQPLVSLGGQAECNRVKRSGFISVVQCTVTSMSDYVYMFMMFILVHK